MANRNRRFVAVPSRQPFRFLFFAAHFVVPLACGFLVAAYYRTFMPLSWQVLVVMGVALLPFLLPLVSVYVGRVFGVEFNEPPRSFVYSRTPFTNLNLGRDLHRRELQTLWRDPSAPDIAVRGPRSAQAAGPVEPDPLPAAEWPDPGALTAEESKMLRTLWAQQRRYSAEDSAARWGFAVGAAAPDYEEFVRGFSNLAKRRLVMQGERGIVFLSASGIEYCKANEAKLDLNGDAWTHFAPA